jgi:hypothetical protein
MTAAGTAPVVMEPACGSHHDPLYGEEAESQIEETDD